MKCITFKDLVMQVDKNQALTYFIDNMRLTGNNDSDTELYEKGNKIFETLQAMEPVTKKDLKLVVWHGMTEEHEVGYDVSGVGYNEFNELQWYAIEMMPWNEWLGMPVEKKTLKELTPAQIVGYSIWEMTFFGWSEEEVQTRISKLGTAAKSE